MLLNVLEIDLILSGENEKAFVIFKMKKFKIINNKKMNINCHYTVTIHRLCKWFNIFIEFRRPGGNLLINYRNLCGIFESVLDVDIDINSMW
jgi:hypothetical protein